MLPRDITKYGIYALTLLISSSMLFVVQPMVAKMIQPVLGGTPAVWNTAMVFFQALLLGGYLYAHVTTKWLGTRRQAVMHLVVLAVGLAFLPIGFSAPAEPAALEHPTPWLLGTLLIGVGWPFFVISTSAPLLQKWFSTIDHHAASDPYHLYSASNVGSVFALIAYPFLIEPRIGLQMQTLLWTVAYVVLCISVAICAVILWKSSPRPPQQSEEDSPPAGATPVTWKRRWRWVLWAFIPSSMMLGVTTFITTDVAPMPLLWIPPLAIYIVSFVLVFARRTWIPHRAWQALFPLVIVVLTSLFLVSLTNRFIALSTVANFAGLAIFCMLFHGLLARDRPHTRYLTEFYLLMSLGGVLGGGFNALLAPSVFHRLLEYPLLLLVAVLAVPATAYLERSSRATLAISTALLVMSALWFLILKIAVAPGLAIAFVSLFSLPLFIALVRTRTSRVALASFVIVVTLLYSHQPGTDELHVERSFFGAHQVIRGDDGHFHTIVHGRTTHGRQYFDDAEGLRHEPAAYHSRHGPLGDVFEQLERTYATPPPIAVIGLGAGAVAAYATPGQAVDFFEIDPVVEQIALDPTKFTYLEDCRGHCSVILGDGRLQIEATEDSGYGLIVQDAYSSTAIPVHLLTVEALKTYLEKLHDDGLLAVHISNRFLDLAPPLVRGAEELGLVSRVQEHTPETSDTNYPEYVSYSRWLVIARTEEALGELADDPDWRPGEVDQDFRLWTDDYANILSIIDFSD